MNDNLVVYETELDVANAVRAIKNGETKVILISRCVGNMSQIKKLMASLSIPVGTPGVV